MKQIKIRLFQREETHNAIDRAEARPHPHLAGRLFFDQHIHIAIAGAGRFARDFHIAEVLQVFEAGFGGFEFDGIEHVTRFERDFASDDLVLGLGVAGNVDAAYFEAGAFGHPVGDAHPVGARIADVR